MGRLGTRFLLILLHSVAIFSTCGSAQSDMRQLLVIKGGVDQVYGNFMTAANGEPAAKVEIWPLVPSEMLDFAPQEGLEKNDIQLAEDGALKIVKQLKSQLNIMMLGWLAPAKFGQTVLNFPIRDTIEQLIVMTPRGMLELTMPLGFSHEGATREQTEVYNVWRNSSPLAKGTILTIMVKGVPEGRQRLWSVIAATALVLIVCSIVLVLRGRRVS